MKSNLILPVRMKTRDMQTFDSGFRTLDAAGNQAGKSLGYAVKTYDGRTVDSTGAFLVGELERLDLTLHAPLAAVTYGRDIDLREDVTIADEVSSFTLSNFASSGSLGTGNGIGNGKAWIGKNSDQIAGVSVDIGKIPNPLTPWGLELKYTILELESAAKLGRPVDAQKFEALQLKHQMDIDEQVYIGDVSSGVKGLINNAGVTAANFPNGVSGFSAWTKKTPDEILADVNAMITTTWARTGWAVMPNRLLLPPAQFGYISTQKIGTAAQVSILKYILDNNILKASGQGDLTILPLKWCIGAGVGGTIGTVGIDRAVIYVKDRQRVRYPMTLLQRTPIQYDSIYHKTTYFCRLGVTEVVYAECIGYFDGL
jgi:hypothetical protein